MGAGAVQGHRKENSDSLQDNLNSSTSGSFSGTSAKRTSGPSVERTRQNSSKTSITQSRSNLSPSSTMKMSCEMCSTNFTLFKRKKFCQECHRFFCSTCLPKPPPTKTRGVGGAGMGTSGRQCSKCKLLMSGQFSRNDLQDWKVKDFRCFLKVRKVPMAGCREKHDLVELVLAQFCTRRRNSLQDQAEHDVFVQHMAARMQNEDTLSVKSDTGEVTTENDQQPENQGLPDQESQNAGPPADDGDADFLNGQWQELLDSMERIQETFRQHTLNQRDHHHSAPDEQRTDSSQKQRCHLDDIHTEDDIDMLSVRQIKELLVNNFVDYKGCCEKAELIARVKRLWRDHQVNKTKAEKIHLRDEEEAIGKSFSTPSPSSKQTAENSSPERPVDPPHDGGSESRIPAADDAPSSPPPSSLSSSLPPSSSLSASKGPAGSGAGGASESGADASQAMDSLCRVCMDALTDCILLECGHMVTCTACGKRLAECPICRQYIVRVVRVFRS